MGFLGWTTSPKASRTSLLGRVLWPLSALLFVVRDALLLVLVIAGLLLGLLMVAVWNTPEPAPSVAPSLVSNPSATPGIHRPSPKPQIVPLLGGKTSSPSSSEKVWVDGYTRKDGTQVDGYWRKK